MELWIRLIVLSAGGVLGVNARYWQGVWMSRWVSPQFPWATFTINVTGSFVIGLLGIALTRWLPHPNFRLLVVTGFLGGYTTFSSFEFESATLWERGEIGLMAAYMVGSLVAGFAAVLLGIVLARAIDSEVRFSAKNAPRDVVPPLTAGADGNIPARSQPAGDLPSEETRRPR